MHTYIVSGLTGSPLYLITGNEPFDPWAEVPGDADGDGDVDQDDLDLITANIGLTTEDGAAGDLNADGTVDAQDLALSVANFGSNGFDGLGIGGVAMCPEGNVPEGYICRDRCDGVRVLLLINIAPECRPILHCPGPGCWMDISPSPPPLCDWDCVPTLVSVFQRFDFVPRGPICGGDHFYWFTPCGADKQA